MAKLVPFRNRLAHHETIVRRPIATHHAEMLALAGLIDPDARRWIDGISQVSQLLELRSRPALRRHVIVETDEVREALNAAALRWPENKDQPELLLLNLIREGCRAIADR